MANLEVIQKLIEKIPEIEKCFHSGGVGFYSSGDWNANKGTSGSMSCDMIYDSPEFKNWRDELVRELSKLKKDEFVEEIISLCNHFSGFGDRRRFDNIASKLNVMKDHLEEYELDDSLLINDDRIPENELSDKMIRALSKMQRNHHYDSSSSEDTMNDYIRDILGESYETNDQTRQGNSTMGDEAGEIDIQICDSGLPIVMIEGVKLDSARKKIISEHINKILVNYDPNGCPYVFILMYVTAVKLDDFYRKTIKYLEDYEFPYERQTDIQDIDTGYAELKHAQTILLRNEKNVRLHFFIAHIV